LFVLFFFHFSKTHTSSNVCVFLFSFFFSHTHTSSNVYIFFSKTHIMFFWVSERERERERGGVCVFTCAWGVGLCVCMFGSVC
jgi:hypothetical protein